MLEGKIGYKKKRIKIHEIRVYFEPECDPGIKPGGLAVTEQMEYLG
jgi:hypothetical protein